MADDSSKKPGPVAHILTLLIVIVGYLYWSGGLSGGSPCEDTIKESLRNPSSASIRFLSEGTSAIGKIAYYEVRAQNGFGGFNVERWACYDEDGQKVAMPW